MTIKHNGLPRSLRLIKSAEFGAVLSAPKEKTFRCYSDYFSLSALKTENRGVVRFGFTVGKHNAHLSVERALIKRLMRESARKNLFDISEALLGREYGLDINIRLKCKMPSVDNGVLSKQTRKKLLQNDIEALFFNFKRKIMKNP